MQKLRWHKKHSEAQYRLRIMGSLIVAELLILAVIFLWPVSKHVKPAPVIFEPQVTAIIEAPVITYQASKSSPSPPPSPQVPIEVPDEIIIEEKKIEFLDFTGIGESDSIGVGTGNANGTSDKVYGDPEQGPSIVYIVEPTIENKTKDKALIYVSFLIGKKGNVEEATIKRMLLFNSEGNPVIEVKTLDDRVTSAIITAAMQWKFRPAKVKGQPVRTLTLQTFTVDF